MSDLFWNFIYLSIAFQVKHLICDYPLQNSYMLQKGKPFPHYILPLLTHASVHGWGTYIIVGVFTRNLLIAACFLMADIACHFIVDRLKASPSLGGRWKPDKPYFWWMLGLDQYLHHMWHLFIVGYLTWPC